MKKMIMQKIIKSMSAIFAGMFLVIVILYSGVDLSRANHPSPPNPGHDASSVGHGTFPGGASDIWRFPGIVDAYSLVAEAGGITLGGVNKTAWPSSPVPPTLKIEQVMGYRTYEDNFLITSVTTRLGNNAGIGALNTGKINPFNGYEKNDVVINVDADYDFHKPFNNEKRIYKGLRCKEENGWFLTGCGYLNTNGTDFDHGVISNGCLAGEYEMGTGKGGLSISCTRTILQ